MPPAPPFSQQELSWATLMRLSLAGDQASYERLLREVTPFIRNLSRRYCRDAQVTEDVVQDVLLAVHRVRHTWDKRRPFSPWLAAIAARRCIDRVRRDSRIAHFEVNDDLAIETFATPTTNQDREVLDDAQAVTFLLAALPDRQRRALEAVKLRSLSTASAASELGETVSALRVIVHRAIKALRKRSGTVKGAVDD